MPFDGSGTFNRVMNWVNDAASGIKIKSDRHDQEDNNFAAGLSNTLTKDGQSLPTANIPMNGKRLTGLGDPVNDQDAMTKKFLTTGAFGGFTEALTISGSDAKGRLKFTGTQAALATGQPLGIEFSQADMFFGVRPVDVPAVGWQPRFVWNDKVDGTGTDFMSLTDGGFLRVGAPMSNIAKWKGGSQIAVDMFALNTSGGIMWNAYAYDNAGAFGKRLWAAGYGLTMAWNASAGSLTFKVSGLGVADAVIADAPEYVAIGAGFITAYSDSIYRISAYNAAGTAWMGISWNGAVNLTGSNTMQFQFAGTNRMTLINSGQLSLNPIGSASGLYIALTPANHAAQALGNSGFAAWLGFGSGGTTNYAGVEYTISGQGWAFYGNTSAMLAGGTWQSSDERLKDDVSDVDGAQAYRAVQAVRIHRYRKKMIPDAGLPDREIGWMAQQLESVIPEAVMDAAVPDIDHWARSEILQLREGDNRPATLKATNDHSMLAMLWAAVQYMGNRIDQLEATA